jgi:rubrerythrin
MAGLIPWLEMELEKAKREMDEATRRFEFCNEALKRAREEQEITWNHERVVIRPEVRAVRGRRKSGVTMIDQIEEILRSHGSLDTQEIFDLLKAMEGREQTTYNSVNNLLYKHKGLKVMRYEDGKWNLMARYRNESEQKALPMEEPQEEDDNGERGGD